MYPGSSPELLAIQKAKCITYTPNTAIILISPLLGYGIPELPNEYANSHKTIGIELSPQLTAITDFSLNQFFSKKVDETIESFVERIFNDLDIILRSVRRFIFVSLNGGRFIYAEQYRQLETTLNLKLLTYWRNRSTILYHGHRWVSNICDNLPLISSSYENMPTNDLDLAISKNHEAIIFIGAGPSLDTALPWLCANQNRLFIIVVDTALSALLLAGIRPQITIVLEGQWHNLDDFSLTQIPSDMECWFDISTHSPTVRFLKQRVKKIRFYVSQFSKLNLLDELCESFSFKTIPALGSVGVTGMYLVLQGQEKANLPLGIIGLDFKNQLGKTHCKNSPSHRKGIQKWNRINPHPWLRTTLSNEPDPVLESYNHLANDVFNIFKLNEQIKLDMRSTGLPLVIDKLSTFDEIFEQKLQMHTEIKQNKPTCSINSQKLRLFINYLIEYLTKIKSNGQLIISNNISMQEYHSLLNRLDLFFIDFPDAEWPPTSKEAILRTIIRADEIIYRLQQSAN